MSDPVADMVLDCSGLVCPLPILKMSKAIKQLGQGQVLKMIATDAGAPADVEAWTRQTKNELLASEQEDGRYVFLVRRTG
jgi:tRNA 2-thiouridine synthesizing protein A